MSKFSVTNTFVSGTSAVASQVNTNFTDILTVLNNLEAGTDTWTHVKVSSTDANPVDISSSSSSGTELSINNSATTADPIITFRLSGTVTFSIGTDDSASDAFKIGTTSIDTNTAITIPSGGGVVYFANGSASAPSISAASDTNTGISFSGSDAILFSTAGVQTWSIDSNGKLKPLGSGLIDIGDTTDFPKGIFLAAGTAGAPSLSFGADPDSGFTRIAANDVGIIAGGVASARFDGSVTATHTRLLVYDVDNGGMERVTVGAPDSGGSGFKLLRIPN